MILHYITLHYITLHYNTVHYSTVHYPTYIHTNTIIYIYSTMIVKMRSLLQHLNSTSAHVLEKCLRASYQPPLCIRQCSMDTSPPESHSQQGPWVASDVCPGNSFQSHPPIETLFGDWICEFLVFFLGGMDGTVMNCIGVIVREAPVTVPNVQLGFFRGHWEHHWNH